MSIESVYMRYHLSGDSRIAKVVLSDKQLTELLSNKNSSLWPILDKRIREELNQEDELPVLFGNVILGPLREKLFSAEVIEIDLTDVHEVPKDPISPWKRWTTLATTLFCPKRVPSNTNGT